MSLTETHRGFIAQFKAHFAHAETKAKGGHHHHDVPELRQKLQNAKKLEDSLLEMLKKMSNDKGEFNPLIARTAIVVGGIYDLYDKPWTSNRELSTNKQNAVRYDELKNKKNEELQSLVKPFAEPHFERQPTKTQIVDAWMAAHILTHRNERMPGQPDPKNLRPKKV